MVEVVTKLGEKFWEIAVAFGNAGKSDGGMFSFRGGKVSCWDFLWLQNSHPLGEVLVSSSSGLICG